MNKRVLLLILLFPLVISAKECDYTKHEEYVKLAPNITYDNNYSKSNDTFSIIVYNIFEDMYVKYNKNTYEPDNENKVTIDGIKPGSNVMVDIYANDGCDQIKAFTILEPYFNKYYGSDACYGYEDKIPVCSSQFTSSKVTLDLLEEAKTNYDNVIKQRPDDDEDKDLNNSIFARIREFVKTWGIKILLVVVTIFVTTTIFSNKFRKIKHGI